MKGILIKDLRLLFQQKNFLIIMLVVTGFLNFYSDTTFTIGYVTIICTFLAISTITYDEYDNGYSFLMTLPVQRKTFVREKYLFSLLCSGCAWIIGVLIAFVYKIVKEGGFPALEFGLGASTIIPVMLLMIAVVLPLEFKFGSERGKIAVFISFGVVFVAAYLISKIYSMAGLDLGEILNSLSMLHLGVIVLFALAVSAVLFVISCRISGNIMEKKEF